MKSAAVGVVLALALAACGGGDDGGDEGGAEFNAAVGKIVNESEKTGGTVKIGHSDELDSLDPGNTYYATAWNFVRLYTRALLTFKQSPNPEEGNQLVPDLAEGLGQVSNGGKTWTYKLKTGVKFEDGTPVTSKDVKYAVERSFAKDVLPNGPGYFAQYIDPEWPGPYKDKTGLEAIQTPDDQTIVFNLKEPFADFDYLVTNPQTAPVPKAKDTGAKYQEHPLSTGPYMFESHEVSKSAVLVKNPNWDAASDPNRKQLVDRIEVTFKVEANDLDNRLIAGTLDADLAGTGVQAAARAKILGDENLRKNADNPLTGFLRYAAIASTVAPFDNIECRKAVQYATDKVSTQAAFGGPVGGDIATTLMPPTVVGHQKFDLYPSGQDNKGDLEKAKAALQACGQPNGFATNIAVRTDRPKEVAVAEALQQGLARVGIKTEIKKFPSGRYFSDFAGVPNYVKQNKLGLMITGWGADWPTGFGFLQQVVDGRSIKPAGNTNQAEVNDPAINKMFDDANATQSAEERAKIYGEIDKKVMEGAYYLPFVYEKTLLYRGPQLANVFVSPSYGMYDWVAISKN
jgi:peptide/nickel transport system substrate-binding protein